MMNLSLSNFYLQQNKVAMKPTLQRKGSIAQAGKLIGGTNKVKKATNRQKKSTQKASGHSSSATLFLKS